MMNCNNFHLKILSWFSSKYEEKKNRYNGRIKGFSGILNTFTHLFKSKVFDIYTECQRQYQRLPGACNRSPGSKLLSITTQLHCGGHLGGRAQLPDTILEEDHPMTIPSKFGFN